MKEQYFIKDLVADLIETLKNNKLDFFKLNHVCTQDTLY
jgi:hypothetical protein